MDKSNDQSPIRLWARIGVTLNITPEDLAALQDADARKARAALLSIIQSDKCLLDGETYFPETEENELYFGSSEKEYDFSPTPLQRSSEAPYMLPEPKNFEVDTPHGTLYIHDKCDPSYPGVWVDLKQPDGRDITLAMVEYIPGGEGLADYDPRNPAEMHRQQNEVPDSRREGNEVTAGFVTRSWPDDSAHDDQHNRTFHTGYPIPRQQTLEDKLIASEKAEKKSGETPRSKNELDRS